MDWATSHDGKKLRCSGSTAARYASMKRMRPLGPRLVYFRNPPYRYFPKAASEQEGKPMTVLDWSRCSVAESIPGKVGGAWVFRGTRLPVATVIENLEDLTIEEVIEQFDVTREQIVAVLDFVARSLRESEHADADSV
jgi:uncharacterized protein (DUF433 family)